MRVSFFARQENLRARRIRRIFAITSRGAARFDPDVRERIKSTVIFAYPWRERLSVGAGCTEVTDMLHWEGGTETLNEKNFYNRY